MSLDEKLLENISNLLETASTTDDISVWIKKNSKLLYGRYYINAEETAPPFKFKNIEWDLDSTHMHFWKKENILRNTRPSIGETIRKDVWKGVVNFSYTGKYMPGIFIPHMFSGTKIRLSAHPKHAQDKSINHYKSEVVLFKEDWPAMDAWEKLTKS